MSVLPTRSPDPWRSPSGTRLRSGRPRRQIESADASEVIDRSLGDFVAGQFPEIWADLSDEGRDMFVRALMEAASRPLDDRIHALSDVIDTWQQAWSLLYAPVDDEPYTPEEAAEAEAALEGIRRGEGIPLDELLAEDGPSR
jgi:hypothetical protein